MENKLKNKFVVFVCATLCCLLWGSAFPMIKKGYAFFEIGSGQAASQILFAGIRFVLAGIFTIVIGSMLSKKMLVPKRTSLKMVGTLAFFQTFMQYVLFYIGLAHTTGVKASIIDGASAFIAIIIASLIFHQEKLTVKKTAACIIGFAGVIAANVSGDSSEIFSFNLFGDSFILLSTIAYAISSVLIKNYSLRENPVTLSGYQFLAGGAVMTLCALVSGGVLPAVNTEGILCLVWLGFVSAGAYSLWGILLKYNDVSGVTVYSFMIPVFGVLLSALIGGESGQAFGLPTLLALLLVSVGIVMINGSKEK